MAEFQDLLSSYGLHVGNIIISVISGFIPIVNIELFLLFVSSSVTNANFFFIAMVASLGQMISKIIMFLSGRGLIKISFKRHEDKVNVWLNKFEQKESYVGIIIFLSAFTGFPPFYVITIAAGAIKFNLPYFLLLGLIGRFLRFILIMYFPAVFRQLIS